MQTLEIIGYKRANLGKGESKRLRLDAQVPGVLYGGTEQIHFYTPMAYLKELVYNSKPHFVDLRIDNKHYKCILQDIQFHPVSEVALHVDFLQIFEEKEIKMTIPLVCVGEAPGVSKGGMLVKRLRSLQVKAYPKNMPEEVKVSVAQLDLGQTAKVRDVEVGNYKILNPPPVPVAMVAIPRALRSKSREEAESKK